MHSNCFCSYALIFDHFFLSSFFPAMFMFRSHVFRSRLVARGQRLPIRKLEWPARVHRPLAACRRPDRSQNMQMPVLTLIARSWDTMHYRITPRHATPCHATSHQVTTPQHGPSRARYKRNGRCSWEPGSWERLSGVDCQTIRLPLHRCVRWNKISLSADPS